MFENLYTTKMSANKKALQSRFSKIRSKSGRFSKMMALVMSIAIAVTMLCATVVMAAVGSDGLEYWDKNEIYFLGSMDFDVYAAGENIPSWVTEDVASRNESISVSIKNYQMREAVTGNVALHTVLELSGSKGITKLYSVTGGRINGAAQTDDSGNYIKGGATSSFHYPYVSKYRFVETTSDSGLAEYTKPFIEQGVLDADTGKRKCVCVEFGIDDKMNIRGIRMTLCLTDESNSLDPSNDEFDALDASLESLQTVGGSAEEFLNSTWTIYFTEFEKNYKNIENDAVNIYIEAASPEEIVLNTDVDLENAKYIDISVMDENGDTVSAGREDFSDKYTLVKGLNSDGILSNAFERGKSYRICVGVLDESRNLIYRWQDYVTIK